MSKKGRLSKEEKRRRKIERQTQRRESRRSQLLGDWSKNFNLDKEWKMYFDGATGPTNPGQSGYGAVLYRNSEEVDTRSQRIGHATSNTAEYRGLIAGLEMAFAHGVEELIVCGDSQLIIRQVFRGMRVLTPHLEPLRDQARDLISRFKFVADAWISREHNKRADELSTQGLPQFERKFNRSASDVDAMRRCLTRILENPSVIRGSRETAFIAAMDAQLDGPRGWCTPAQWKWLQDIESRISYSYAPAAFNPVPRLVKQGSGK